MSLSFPVRVPEGTCVHIVNVFPTQGGGRTHSLSVSVAPHAEVSIVSIIPPQCCSTVRVQQRGVVETGGKIHWWNATFGGGRVQHELLSEVIGDGGESSVDWLFLAQQEQQYDLRVRNVFRAAHGSGEVTVKGVAGDSAHVRCRGSISIEADGQGTNTHLTQHVLMLDASAKVDAVPALEIATNDVKAGHSATVTKVSEEDIFYGVSRGIDLHEVRRMLVEGFFREVIDRMEDGESRELLEKILRKIL